MHPKIHICQGNEVLIVNSCIFQNIKDTDIVMHYDKEDVLTFSTYDLGPTHVQ